MDSFNNHSGLKEVNSVEAESNSISNDQDRQKKHKRDKTILLILLAILVALFSFLGFYVYRILFDPVSAFEQADKQGAGAKAPDENQKNSTVKKVTNRINILILGMDIDEDREKTNREDFRSDTILLASVDFTNNKVDLITIPRDSYANVKNATGKFFKINSAVYFGGGICDAGFKNACDTISELFGGIEIDYYIALEMPGLEKLIDTIGGVYYNVDVPVNYKGFKIKEGYQKLNGKQVLTYCRVRKGIGTDVDRQGRQFKMILAILKQLKNNSQLSNLPQIYQSMEDMTFTNLSFEQICTFAVLATKINLDKDIRHYTLEGEYHTAYGHSLYLIDQKKKVELVKKIFEVDIPEDKEHDLYFVLQDSGGK